MSSDDVSETCPACHVMSEHAEGCELAPPDGWRPKIGMLGLEHPETAHYMVHGGDDDDDSPEWIEFVDPAGSVVMPFLAVANIVDLVRADEPSTIPDTDTTPDAVAAALAKVLPRRTSIFDVELVQSTRGCTARARIGTSPHAQREITGLGQTLAEAIVALGNEAMS